MTIDNERAAAAAAKLGLHHGRMISASKSWYRRAYPENVVVFNAALADVDGRDLWRGDLDLTVDETKLIALAAELGTTVHVLYESDARLIGREEPYRLDLAPAVVRVTPGGETILGEIRWGVPLTRNAAGQLVSVRSE
jgi:hypothetical protein